MKRGTDRKTAARTMCEGGAEYSMGAQARKAEIDHDGIFDTVMKLPNPQEVMEKYNSERHDYTKTMSPAVYEYKHQ